MRGERGRRSARVGLLGLVAEVGGRTRAGLQQGFGSRPVLLLALASAIQVGSWAPYFMEWPQYFHENLGVAIWMIGWLYCFLQYRPADWRRTYRAVPAGQRKSRIAAGRTRARQRHAAAVRGSQRESARDAAMLFMMNMCSGAMQPVAQTWINEHLEAHNRATLLSFQSTFATFGGALGLLLCGWIADRHGLLAAWVVAGMIGLGPAISLLEAESRKGRVAGSDRACHRQFGRLATEC